MCDVISGSWPIPCASGNRFAHAGLAATLCRSTNAHLVVDEPRASSAANDYIHGAPMPILIADIAVPGQSPLLRDKAQQRRSPMCPICDGDRITPRDGFWATTDGADVPVAAFAAEGACRATSRWLRLGAAYLATRPPTIPIRLLEGVPRQRWSQPELSGRLPRAQNPAPIRSSSVDNKATRCGQYIRSEHTYLAHRSPRQSAGLCGGPAHRDGSPVPSTLFTSEPDDPRSSRAYLIAFVAAS